MRYDRSGNCRISKWKIVDLLHKICYVFCVKCADGEFSTTNRCREYPVGVRVCDMAELSPRSRSSENVLCHCGPVCALVWQSPYRSRNIRVSPLQRLSAGYDRNSGGTADFIRPEVEWLQGGFCFRPESKNSNKRSIENV